MGASSLATQRIETGGAVIVLNIVLESSNLRLAIEEPVRPKYSSGCAADVQHVTEPSLGGW